jgi:hypothetical protein
MWGVMTDLTLQFASAYRQLRPSERAFVDSYVASVERDAVRNNERISNALYRPIPAGVVEASRGMFDRPLVCAAITERIHQIAAASELTPERLIKEVVNIAFANIADYGEVGEDGVMRWDMAKCTPEQMSAVKKIKVETNPRNPFQVAKIEVELHPKLEAIDRLMRYMGLLDADNPHWRADSARPVATALPGNATTAQASDAYAAMING